MKKGFTLIELLAVIVILAVLAVITVPIVLDIIDDSKKTAEYQSAVNLLEEIKSYVLKEELVHNWEDEALTLIIKDDVVYSLSSDGTKTLFDEFNYKGKLCDYCVIKLTNEEEISILYEGDKQDIVKDYDDKKLTQKDLTESREVMSLYNELLLFKDIYVLNNEVTGTKYFSVEEDEIYEITNSSELVSNLFNSSGKAILKLTSDDYEIIITDKDKELVFDSEGNKDKNDGINNKYDNETLILYDELKLSVENYASKNTINEELYFEYNNGVINKVDKYGNTIQETNISIPNNISGSGEIRINPSKEVSITIYDGDTNIKNDYGSNQLYDEKLKYSREGLELFRNLNRLELLAEAYSGNKTKSDWLVYLYIARLKYSGTMYDMVIGKDDTFTTYVSDNAPNLKTYFSSKNAYTVNNHKVDLKHMAASLAGLLTKTSSIALILHEELEYDCVVSWAGDLHTLMEKSILKTGVKEEYGNYLNATYNLVGKSGTSFAMEDVYADIDAWVLYYNIKENTNLSMFEILDSYYSGTSARSYKNRYTSFINIMNDIAPKFKKSLVNFNGVAEHFSTTNWETIGTLEITPTTSETKEIAQGFVKFINEKASKE